jgi:hypothetical protein
LTVTRAWKTGTASETPTGGLTEAPSWLTREKAASLFRRTATRILLSTPSSGLKPTPTAIGADNSYEVNIWDIRPDPIYGTGGIVDFAAVPVPVVYKVGGKWNTYEIYAKGDQMTVKLNGTVTVGLRDGKYASGPFALQFGAGVKGVTGGPIKWRKVQVRPL